MVINLTIIMDVNPMITYYETDANELDLIKELWEKLNSHHKARSKYFYQEYEKIVFEDRKKQLLTKVEEGNLRIDLAVDTDSKKSVGYCVSSFSNRNGEIDSIYVDENFRNMGIGDSLMRRALKWMDKKDVVNREIKLSTGNDDAIQFYSHYGFHPKHIILKQRK
jgi:ribosomal protein S18 acetylase RimI-like enzyme